jgi:(p)ppGpp synthase/HD superfamily hydrolase
MPKYAKDIEKNKTISFAVSFAAIVCEGMVQEGTQTPYIVCLGKVGERLVSSGNSGEEVIAGMLFHLLGNNLITMEQVRSTFGMKVAWQLGIMRSSKETPSNPHVVAVKVQDIEKNTMITKALGMAAHVHELHECEKKEIPYIFQLIEVAEYLSKGFESGALSAARIIRDALAEDILTLEQVRDAFGEKTAEFADEMVEQIRFVDKIAEQIRSVEKLSL